MCPRPWLIFISCPCSYVFRSSYWHICNPSKGESACKEAGKMRLEGKVSDLEKKRTCNSIFRSCYKWCSISHPRCSHNYLYVCDVCAQDYVCKDADIFHFKFNTTSWSRLSCKNSDCLFFCKMRERPEMTSWHGFQDLLQTDVFMCIYNCYN